MSTAKSGWVTFSWLILLMAGLVNLLYGAAAIGRSAYFPQTGLVAENLSTHGGIWIVLGGIQVLTAILIQRRLQFGLMVGLTLAVISAVVWFFYMLFLPSNGFALVLLYSLVIYGLGAHMDEFASA